MDRNDLPPELGAKLLTFLRETETGGFEVVDMPGLCGFIVEYGEQYPSLLDLVKPNEDAIVDHYKQTGEVPPGVKLVVKTQHEGDNVIGLEILRGPISPKE